MLHRVVLFLVKGAELTCSRRAAALFAACVAGLFLLAPGAGCDECDAETKCLGKEGLLVEDEIYPVCGAEPTSDGDRYSWATDTGTCSCTLESGALTGYNWRDCEFFGTNVAGETSSSGTVGGGSDECGAEDDCELCVFAACRWCPATNGCVSYDDESCSEREIESSSQCQNGFASDACTPYAANEPPPGSYGASCQNITVTEPYHIHAECDHGGGEGYGPVDFYFGNCASAVVNDYGTLYCPTHCD